MFLRVAGVLLQEDPSSRLNPADNVVPRRSDEEGQGGGGGSAVVTKSNDFPPPSLPRPSSSWGGQGCCSVMGPAGKGCSRQFAARSGQRAA